MCVIFIEIIVIIKVEILIINYLSNISVMPLNIKMCDKTKSLHAMKLFPENFAIHAAAGTDAT